MFGEWVDWFVVKKEAKVQGEKGRGGQRETEGGNKVLTVRNGSKIQKEGSATKWPAKMGGRGGQTHSGGGDSGFLSYLARVEENGSEGEKARKGG